MAEAVREDVERGREVGTEGVGPSGGELATDLKRLLGALERLLAATQFAEADRDVVERGREVGAEGVGPSGGELAIDLKRLLGALERLLAATQFAEADRDVAERGREAGAEGVGPSGGELAIDLERLLGGLERLLAFAEGSEVYPDVAQQRGKRRAIGEDAGRLEAPPGRDDELFSDIDHTWSQLDRLVADLGKNSVERRCDHLQRNGIVERQVGEPVDWARLRWRSEVLPDSNQAEEHCYRVDGGSPAHRPSLVDRHRPSELDEHECLPDHVRHDYSGRGLACRWQPDRRKCFLQLVDQTPRALIRLEPGDLALGSDRAERRVPAQPSHQRAERREVDQHPAPRILDPTRRETRDPFALPLRQLTGKLRARSVEDDRSSVGRGRQNSHHEEQRFPAPRVAQQSVETLIVSLGWDPHVGADSPTEVNQDLPSVLGFAHTPDHHRRGYRHAPHTQFVAGVCPRDAIPPRLRPRPVEQEHPHRRLVGRDPGVPLCHARVRGEPSQEFVHALMRCRGVVHDQQRPSAPGLKSGRLAREHPFEVVVGQKTRSPSLRMQLVCQYLCQPRLARAARTGDQPRRHELLAVHPLAQRPKLVVPPDQLRQRPPRAQQL